MDLVAGVRKEGSRGGRNEFKWSDVKESSHRENYLGHSLMAPVGRWQQNRDLQWYAKGDEDDEDKARRDREELQRVKQAEQEAMARALGLPLPPSGADTNANLTPLGGTVAVQGSAGGDIPSDEVARGVGYESHQSRRGSVPRAGDAGRYKSAAVDSGARGNRRRRDEHSRSPRRDRIRDRDRESDRDRDRYHKHRRPHDERESHHRGHRYRSRSRSHDRERRRRRSPLRSRSRDRKGDDGHRRRREDHQGTRHRDHDSDYYGRR